MSRRAIALVVGFLAACDLIGSPATDLVVATDKASYELSPGEVLAPIRLIVTNTSEHSLEIGRCGEHIATYIDQRMNSRWQVVGQLGLVCQANVPMVPLRLAPGATFVSEPMRVASGRYRFRVLYGRVGGPAHSRIAMSNVTNVSSAP
jgi:hypothetical protein